MLSAPLLLATTLMATLPTSDVPAPDLLDVARQAGSFTTLIAALEAAELDEVLRGDGPFTVFAPTDEAFAALPPGSVEALLQPGSHDALTALLQNHVVAGRVSAAAAVQAGSATSLLGETLAVRIENGALRIGDSGVRANDLQARNGVIHVLDGVLLPAPSARFGPLVVFDFDAVRAQPWPSVNDDVMGGISRGASRLGDAGTLLFSGALSLDNNGGFSTVRSRADALGLGGWDGVVLRVRGDGRRYNFSALGGDSRNQLHRWEQPFDTVADTWIEVEVRFDGLTHRVMGRNIPDGPIDPAAIRSLAFGISDKDTTPFALEVDWIKAFRER